jgi:hypothetical protein
MSACGTDRDPMKEFIYTVRTILPFKLCRAFALKAAILSVGLHFPVARRKTTKSAHNAFLPACPKLHPVFLLKTLATFLFPAKADPHVDSAPTEHLPTWSDSLDIKVPRRAMLCSRSAPWLTHSSRGWRCLHAAALITRIVSSLIGRRVRTAPSYWLRTLRNIECLTR